MNDAAARAAMKAGDAPLVIWNDDTLEGDLQFLPVLGDFVPRGWRVASKWDHTISGGLSHTELCAMVRHIRKNTEGRMGFALREDGGRVRIFIRE